MNLAWGWWRLNVVYNTLQKRWGVSLPLIVARKVRGGEKGFVERRILAGADAN